MRRQTIKPSIRKPRAKSARLAARIRELVANFDHLPDDAVVPWAVLEAIGGPSPRTCRRSPPIPRIKLSEKLGGGRVGDWRRLVRGEQPTA